MIPLEDHASMTQVEFYSGITDKPASALRLVRRAFGKGVRVAVVAEESILTRLDHHLWIDTAGDFVPHVLVNRAVPTEARLRRTPVWLVADAADAVQCDVLVNLSVDVPSSLPAFKRVIELVSTDEADVALGRRRWRRYQSMPVQLSHPNARTVVETQGDSTAQNTQGPLS